MKISPPTFIVSIMLALGTGCEHTYHVRIDQRPHTSLPVLEVKNTLDAWLGNRGYEQIHTALHHPSELDVGVDVARWKNSGQHSFWWGGSSIDVAECEGRREIFIFLEGNPHYTKPFAKDVATVLKERFPQYAVSIVVGNVGLSF